MSVQLTDVPAPVSTPDGAGGTIYTYSTVTGLAGNATLTIGSQTISNTALTMVIVIGSNPRVSSFNLTVGLLDLTDSLVGAASLDIGWLSGVLDSGNLPNPIPSISDSYVSIMAAAISSPTHVGTPPIYTVNSVSSCNGLPGGTTSSAAPSIQSIVNAASFQNGIASGSWITILGSNLSSTTRVWGASDFIDNQLPTSLDGVQVTINGIPAYISYISPTQVNALAPDDPAAGPVSVQVTTAAGVSNLSMANKEATAPALFVFSQGGGKYAIAQDASSYGLIAPAGLLGAATTTPASSGETIVLYATGLGATNPAYPAGQLFSGAFPVANQPQVLIGNAAAQVLFAGAISPGLYQLNVVVPSLANGDAAIQIMDGAQSPTGIFLPIQNP